MAETTERCPSKIPMGMGGYSGSGGPPRQIQCQKPAGHTGQCSYHRRGGQGGSLTRWWGANPEPPAEPRLTMTVEQAQMYAERGRKLTEIRKLHQDAGHGYCDACWRKFPCPTLQIIESEASHG